MWSIWSDFSFFFTKMNLIATIITFITLLALQSAAIVVKSTSIENRYPFISKSNMTFRQLQSTEKDLVLNLTGGFILYAHSEVLAGFLAYPFIKEGNVVGKGNKLSNIDIYTMNLILSYFYTGEMVVEKSEMNGVGAAFKVLLIEEKLLNVFWHSVVQGFCDWFTLEEMSEATKPQSFQNFFMDDHKLKVVPPDVIDEYYRCKRGKR
jgi:hypothetical protein